MLANHNCAKCVLDEDTCKLASLLNQDTGKVTEPCDAYETYAELVSVLGFDPISRPVGAKSKEMCCACDTDLGTCSVIWSAEGRLYCSKDCGIHDYNDDEAAFNSYAEEINPLDIGIERTCCWCHKTDEDAKPTSLGYLCDICIKAIRSRGEEVLLYE